MRTVTSVMVLAEDLAARERSASAALELAGAEGIYGNWAQEQRDHALEEQALRLLQAEVSHLLEGLRSLLHDDDFWVSLRVDTTGDDAGAQLQALQSLNRSDLAAMFDLVGYTVPPPPPATELIDAAKSALSALDRGRLTETELASAVQRAQSDLTVLLWRARGQIEVAERAPDPAERGAIVRTAARTVLRGTRELMPVVAGAATGVAVTGTPAGAIAGAAAGKFVEKLLEKGIDVLLSSALLIGAQMQEPSLEVRAAAGVDSIALHLSRLRSLQQEPWACGSADEANQHISRLAELVDAHGSNHWGRTACHLIGGVRSDEAGGRQDLQAAIDGFGAAMSGNFSRWSAKRRAERQWRDGNPITR